MAWFAITSVDILVDFFSLGTVIIILFYFN